MQCYITVNGVSSVDPTFVREYFAERPQKGDLVSLVRPDELHGVYRVQQRLIDRRCVFLWLKRHETFTLPSYEECEANRQARLEQYGEQLRSEALDRVLKKV